MTLPSNADIVTRSVSILKIMADFVSNEKKKQEESLHSSRLNVDSERRRSIEDDRLASPRMSPRLVQNDEPMNDESSSEESV